MVVVLQTGATFYVAPVSDLGSRKAVYFFPYFFYQSCFGMLYAKYKKNPYIVQNTVGGCKLTSVNLAYPILREMASLPCIGYIVFAYGV